MKINSLFWWIFAFFGGGGLALWATAGNAIVLRMSIICALLLIIGGIWSVYLSRGIVVNRDARLLRARVGDIFEEKFTVTLESWPGCPWIEIIDRTTLASSGGSRLLTRVGKGEKRFFLSRTLLTRRGAYLLGPTLVSSGDPFRLFRLNREIKSNEVLIVYPMIYAISEFPPPAGLLPGGRFVRTKTSDITPHAAGIRDYVPGDPMQRIHWPSTAKRNQFMVKEFEQDPQSDIWLFVDCQKDAQYSRERVDSVIPEEMILFRKSKIYLPCDTFEYVVSSTGSLAQHFLKNHRSVGMVCSTEKFLIVPSDKGERQVAKILESLSFLQADGSMRFIGLVNSQIKQLPISTGVILITASVNYELLLIVENLQRRHLCPVVIIISRETFSGEQSDTRDLIDSLRKCNVPVCDIGFGDDLSKKLSLPVVYLQKPYLSKSYIQDHAN